jgi:ATP-binding cassette subfamily F protein 3
MLTLAGIGKSYGERVLFANASLHLDGGDRIGLVGPNGAGKSTLFSILLGEMTPDAGEISMQRGLRIGHLPQESAPTGDETVLDLAVSTTPELAELRRRMRLAAAGHDEHEAHEARQHFEDLDGHALEVKARQMLRGLAFRERDFDRPANTMSGGWVMRAHLARLLTQEPDLLLLDEPTNHLDLEALIWFQEHLKHYPGAILVISHDREFLNQLVGAIVEIRQSRLFRYTGNYDDFLEQREAGEEQMLAAWKNQQREIARLQLFIDRFRAKNTKAAQAKSKQKQIDRMTRVDAPQGDEASIDFQFPQPERSGLKVITLENIDHAYGDLVVYRGMNFEAERGQRIVLVGPNGAGKSTLLKILAGVVTPVSGGRRPGYNVKTGYYAQYRTDMLDPERTVLEEAMHIERTVGEMFARTVLGGFLFRGDDVFKRVGMLSGGEKSRLALVKLLLDPPNLLLMDEPTTHLDIPSTEALAAALDQFEGTLIFISHDVYFIRSIARHVVHVKDGVLRHFPGDYQYYLDKTAAEAARMAVAPRAVPVQYSEEANAAEQRRQQRRLDAEERNARYRERQVCRQRVGALEKEIAGLEARDKALTAEFEDPDTFSKSNRVVEINRELREIHERLPVAMSEWEEAAGRLAALE